MMASSIPDRPVVESVRALARSLEPRLVAWRRDLHAHPETAFEERRTAEVIGNELQTLGIEHIRGIGGTGIIATIHGAQRGGVVGLRADMDALPVQEEGEASYRSTVSGVMHACGHDAHTAILLGVAHILSQLRDRLQGDVVLVFQPAEEIGAGARAMADSRAVPKLDALISLHVGLGGLRAGQIGVAAGPLLAGARFFEATFLGQGGHGAHPELAVNPIPPCADWILGVDRVITAETSALVPRVATVTSVHAGANANVIPQQASCQGSIRSLDEATLARLEDRLARSADHCAAAARAQAQFQVTRSFPVTVNARQLVESARPVLEDLLGRNQVVEPQPIMGSEDVSWLSPAPLLYLFLGSQSPSVSYANHHPRFDIDESCLSVGASAEAALAISLLPCLPWVV